jgi:hypothetical protein
MRAFLGDRHGAFTIDERCPEGRDLEHSPERDREHDGLPPFGERAQSLLDVRGGQQVVVKRS